MIGETINARYQVTRRLGRGGFGTVYLCTDLNLKRPVAVKCLDLETATPQTRERFAREAEWLANLHHPSIVTLYDYGEHDGAPYLVMQYVDGPTLHDVALAGPVPLADTLAWAAQIADGMGYAHERGIVHRDLSLRNVMLDRDGGGVRILDFGLAKFVQSAGFTSTRSVFGTPSYMSPEQVTGAAVDHRTDIFSFGVCLYRLACGAFPFEAEHPTAVMYFILNKTDFAFPPELPPDVAALITACLAKEPAGRPASFEAVSRLLAALAPAGEVTVETTIARSARLAPLAGPARTSKRNPYLNRVMIKNPEDFFGRRKEITKIYSRLDAPHPQSISIVGERRIGKSSLLNYVYHRANRRRNMTRHADSVFVYLDFQHDKDFTVAKFVDFLFSAFDYELQGKPACKDRDRTLAQLKMVVQEMTALDKRIIVLMDEFEVITNNQNFDSDFFSFLRALANSYKVAYVTSSCLELQALCHNQDISDSPFFNIFSNLPLRPFAREEALELIGGPSRREGVDLSPHADRILDLAGRHPMMIQIACAAVFEHLATHEGGQVDWAKVEAAFHEEAHPHYQFIWERLDDTERRCLGRLSQGQPVSRKLQYVRDAFVRTGMITTEGSRDRITARAFRDYVRENAQRSGDHGPRLPRGLSWLRLGGRRE